MARSTLLLHTEAGGLEDRGATCAGDKISRRLRGPVSWIKVESTGLDFRETETRPDGIYARAGDIAIRTIEQAQ